MMGAIFHNYKQLLQFNKEDAATDEEYLREEIESLLETKTEVKILSYRYSKKWHGFLYSLHKEDRLILLKMILDICSYNECITNVINIHDSQLNIDCMFFLLSMMLQQKRIDRLDINKKREVTLLDFMYK
jgi:hypothetical protein